MQYIIKIIIPFDNVFYKYFQFKKCFSKKKIRFLGTIEETYLKILKNDL